MPPQCTGNREPLELWTFVDNCLTRFDNTTKRKTSLSPYGLFRSVKWLAILRILVTMISFPLLALVSLNHGPGRSQIFHYRRHRATNGQQQRSSAAAAPTAAAKGSVTDGYLHLNVVALLLKPVILLRTPVVE
jgi:hypothetical protein